MFYSKRLINAFTCIVYDRLDLLGGLSDIIAKNKIFYINSKHTFGKSIEPTENKIGRLQTTDKLGLYVLEKKKLTYVKFT